MKPGLAGVPSSSSEKWGKSVVRPPNSQTRELEANNSKDEMNTAPKWGSKGGTKPRNEACRKQKGTPRSLWENSALYTDTCMGTKLQQGEAQPLQSWAKLSNARFLSVGDRGRDMPFSPGSQSLACHRPSDEPSHLCDVCDADRTRLSAFILGDQIHPYTWPPRSRTEDFHVRYLFNGHLPVCSDRRSHRRIIRISDCRLLPPIFMSTTWALFL